MQLRFEKEKKKEKKKKKRRRRKEALYAKPRSCGTMALILIMYHRYLHTSDLRPVLAVASAASNSVSIYQVADEPFSQASHN